MSKITNLLGDQAAFYLEHTCSTIDKSLIHIPSSSTIDDTWISSDRNIRTLSSIQTLLGHGRLANTGYVYCGLMISKYHQWCLKKGYGLMIYL